MKIVSSRLTLIQVLARFGITLINQQREGLIGSDVLVICEHERLEDAAGNPLKDCVESSRIFGFDLDVKRLKLLSTENYLPSCRRNVETVLSLFITLLHRAEARCE